MSKKQYFTAVFEYDVTKFDGNPHKAETPFGSPVVTALGNYADRVDELEDMVDGLDSDLHEAVRVIG